MQRILFAMPTNNFAMANTATLPTFTISTRRQIPKLGKSAMQKGSCYFLKVK